MNICGRKVICSEDLTGSDQSEEESFDIIPPVSSSPNNMDTLLDKMEVPQLTWEDEVKRVEEKLSGVKCTALARNSRPLRGA